MRRPLHTHTRTHTHTHTHTLNSMEVSCLIAALLKLSLLFIFCFALLNSCAGRSQQNKSPSEVTVFFTSGFETCSSSTIIRRKRSSTNNLICYSSGVHICVHDRSLIGAFGHEHNTSADTRLSVHGPDREGISSFFIKATERRHEVRSQMTTDSDISSRQLIGRI